RKDKTLSFFLIMISTETYVKAFALIFGVYGLQMGLVPGKMVTDHFEAPATPLLKFWIRGQSVSLIGMCYLLTQVPSDKGALIGTIASFAVGVLYPWNAKFGYITPGLPVKYPMHYVPE
ncbi:hypothetical protein TrRE_jg1561, partial [Triparma retinervis]